MTSLPSALTIGSMFTIGQLAKRVGMRASALRYYEAEGLLQPNGRSDSGYRLYGPEAEQTLRLIQRAQRLGFALTDIRQLLKGWHTGHLSDEALLQTAESRHLTLERQITELLVLQHELELFLQDLHQREREETAVTPFDRLLERVCANPAAQPTSKTLLNWLGQYTGCVLMTQEGQTLLNRLRGQHSHIWQEEDTYHILVVSHETAVGQALESLARLESNCQTHSHPTPELTDNHEGFLFTARGENAFIFARLFLALEQEREEGKN